jgi:hypothetical protein
VGNATNEGADRGVVEAAATVKRGGAAHRLRIAAVLLAFSALTGCTSGDPSEETTAGDTPSSAAPGTTMTPEPPSVPVREARDGWKMFSDPARSLSFELPEAWVVQPVEPEPGTHAPDSLHYAVRTPEGVTTAELHTGIITQEQPCPEAELTPYHVIGSEPVQLDDAPPAATDIGPRFVVRLITGFRFFGSFGLTDQVGGADGLACSLSNTVDTGGDLGRVSFGDLEVLAPKLPADTGPRTVSFGTIGEAEAYYGTPGFATVRQMVQSLRVVAPPQ